MSVVAVKIYDDKIEISADQQATYGTNNKETSAGAKLFYKNGITVGYCGKYDEGTLLKLYCATTKPSRADEEAISMFLVGFQEWLNGKTEDSTLQNQNIIIYGGVVFRTYGVCAETISDYSAIGSGMFCALPVLALGHNTAEAVDMAKRFVTACGGETETITIEI